MDNSDQRSIRDEDDRINGANYASPYSPNALLGQKSNGIDMGALNKYTLMVAGQRTGKTSFLRLLLDTSDVAPSVSKDQLASVAKFVQGSSGHTTHIRIASIDIEQDVGQNPHRLALSLVDTPSLDSKDELASERAVTDILRHIDSRFMETIEDEWPSQGGDNHVHLCIYFLDPDHIVPPSVPGPPAPPLNRTRTNSEPERVILEPPVTTNPLLCRPTLPAIEIKTIRRLSARVNVLPVVARADTLTNERLAAVKLAIRRDLAEAGIGFGIFDMDSHGQYIDNADHAASGEPTNGYPNSNHLNGTSSTATSPPTSPVTPPLLRLPYALISPDIYSHSDGVTRVPLSRHELAQQYTPLPRHNAPSKFTRGRFVRNYRWGSMDVLDPGHSDFLPLRSAIFHHMETLQKYTRDYLFDKFLQEFRIQQQQQQPHHSLPHHIQQGIPSHSHLPPIPHATRPILAIDTAPPSALNHHPSLSIPPREMTHGTDMRSGQAVRTAGPDPASSNVSAKSSSSGTRSSKQRTKKITVACNFCRSRKLKCDGLQPCSQCQKRSNPCDYIPQNKRRGALRQRKQDDDNSESEGISGEDRSADQDQDEPSLSPEVPSQPLSRRSSNVGKFPGDPDTFGSSSSDRTADNMALPPPVRQKLSASSSPADSRTTMFRDNELPHIATLSLPESSAPPTGSMTAPLPPIRPASELQAAQRKRAATVPGKVPRTPSTSGPKVVACNFCRARKTKCDGAHPACSSCTRRSLACNYSHENSGANGQGPKKGTRRASTSKVGGGAALAPPPVPNSPSSSAQPPQRLHLNGEEGYFHREQALEQRDIDLKRNLEDMEMGQPQKKMRIEGPPTMIAGIR